MSVVKIIVKKFRLLHAGQMYKAGDVVEIEDEKLAKRLVAHANGELDFYHGDTAGGNASESDSAPDGAEMEDVAGIPAVDPNAGVSIASKPNGKGKK